MSKTNNYHTMASFEAQVEHLLDTHPRVLSLEEREILRPNMQQILLFLQELNIDLETYESQLVTFQVDGLRYN
jgi:hypothetical protein